MLRFRQILRDIFPHAMELFPFIASGPAHFRAPQHAPQLAQHQAITVFFCGFGDPLCSLYGARIEPDR
jgi:hypothetical protein